MANSYNAQPPPRGLKYHERRSTYDDEEAELNAEFANRYQDDDPEMIAQKARSNSPPIVDNYQPAVDSPCTCGIYFPREVSMTFVAFCALHSQRTATGSLIPRFELRMREDGQPLESPPDAVFYQTKSMQAFTGLPWKWYGITRQGPVQYCPGKSAPALFVPHKNRYVVASPTDSVASTDCHSRIPDVTCVDCRITCSSKVSYQQHLLGKTHQKKKAGTGTQLTCDRCQVRLSGINSAMEHAVSDRHRKVLGLKPLTDRTPRFPADDKTFGPFLSKTAKVAKPSTGAQTRPNSVPINDKRTTTPIEFQQTPGRTGPILSPVYTASTPKKRPQTPQRYEPPPGSPTYHAESPTPLTQNQFRPIKARRMDSCTQQQPGNSRGGDWSDRIPTAVNFGVATHPTMPMFTQPPAPGTIPVRAGWQFPRIWRPTAGTPPPPTPAGHTIVDRVGNFARTTFHRVRNDLHHIGESYLNNRPPTISRARQCSAIAWTCAVASTTMFMASPVLYAMGYPTTGRLMAFSSRLVGWAGVAASLVALF
jgi:hypothetical protein